MSRIAAVRGTADIDFAIRLQGDSQHELAAELGGSARIGDANDPLLAVIQFSAGSGAARVNIQLVQFPKSIEEAAFIEPARQRVKGISVPFASWKGLLMLELYAGGALDLADAQSILEHINPTSKQKTELRAVAERLRLASRLTSVQRQLSER